GTQQRVHAPLTGRAGAQALGGQPAGPAQLRGAADAAGPPGGASLPPSDSADVKRITAVTRQALGGAAFAAEFQSGRRLRPEQASSLLQQGRRQHRAYEHGATGAVSVFWASAWSAGPSGASGPRVDPGPAPGPESGRAVH